MWNNYLVKDDRFYFLKKLQGLFFIEEIGFKYRFCFQIFFVKLSNFLKVLNLKFVIVIELSGIKKLDECKV